MDTETKNGVYPTAQFKFGCQREKVKHVAVYTAILPNGDERAVRGRLPYECLDRIIEVGQDGISNGKLTFYARSLLHQVNLSGEDIDGIVHTISNEVLKSTPYRVVRTWDRRKKSLGLAYVNYSVEDVEILQGIKPTKSDDLKLPPESTMKDGLTSKTISLTDQDTSEEKVQDSLLPILIKDSPFVRQAVGGIIDKLSKREEFKNKISLRDLEKISPQVWEQVTCMVNWANKKGYRNFGLENPEDLEIDLSKITLLIYLIQTKGLLSVRDEMELNRIIQGEVIERNLSSNKQ